MVNDTVGDKPIVVIWEGGVASALDSPYVADGRDVGTVNVYSRDLQGRGLTFRWDGTKIVDEQTGSEWNILGRAVAGDLLGSQLDPIIAINHFWFSWQAFRPDTRVYDGLAG